MIEVKQLTKTYGSAKALDRLSLNFELGQQYAIVGSSGSGKSTLLYLMGGLDRPTSGDIVIDGESLFHKNDRELALYRNQQVGFIFQFHFLLPNMSGLDNICLPAQIGGRSDMDKIKSRAKELADHLHVTHCLNKFPHEMSGGEQQRINVIRALSLKPKVLLCDEPTGNLDSQNSQKVIVLLRDLARQFAATLAVVTHDGEVARVFERQYHLKDGRLAHRDGPSNIA